MLGHHQPDCDKLLAEYPAMLSVLQLLVRKPYGVVQSFSKVTQPACL
jgi:hypothetical protein